MQADPAVSLHPLTSPDPCLSLPLTPKNEVKGLGSRALVIYKTPLKYEALEGMSEARENQSEAKQLCDSAVNQLLPA